MSTHTTTTNTDVTADAVSGQNFRDLSMYADGRVELDGETVDGNGINPYSAALVTLAGHAAREGNLVLVRGVDHGNGDESWFTVDAENNTRIVEKPATPEPSADTAVQVPEPVPAAAPVVASSDVPANKNTNHADHGVVPTSEVAPALDAAPRPAGVSASAAPPAADIMPGQDPERNEEEVVKTTDVPAPTPTPAPTPGADQPATSVAGSPPAPLSAVGSPAGTDALPLRADVRFVVPVKERPRAGLRGALYTMTAGAVNLGPSAQEQEEEALIRRISRQLHGSHTTAFLSLKGGIGKTSTTTGVGMIMAEYRGNPPCALDTNPDAGDLAERVLGEALYDNATPRTITDIVRDLPSIDSLTKLSSYMHHANRLHVIAGEQDPALSDALTAEHYLSVQSLVANYYSVVLADCGTGVSHPAMAGVLSTASNLVIASGYAVSGAKRAKATIEWLAAHGYEHLSSNSVVVVTDKDQVSTRVDRRAIEDHLAGAAKTLVTVPHDRGVADGDQISLDHISRATRQAYMKIAAAIVDGYQ